MADVFNNMRVILKRIAIWK